MIVCIRRIWTISIIKNEKKSLRDALLNYFHPHYVWGEPESTLFFQCTFKCCEMCSPLSDPYQREVGLLVAGRRDWAG